MSDEWVPDPVHPAFTVQRAPYGDVEGGDYARAGEDLPKAALRYAEQVPSSQEIAEQSSLVSFVRSYDTIDLTWGWPEKYDSWESIALVRSGFGHPSTVNDGVVIYRVERDDFDHVDSEDHPLSIMVKDTPLQAGRWYYYTLFFFTAAETWLPVLYTEALIPRDFAHRDHLWNGVPPYYQFVDSQFRGEHGYLRQFLNTFGFELDMTREYVESWQEAYHSDFSPVPLLKRAGENLGLPFESGLGEIRYRAMVGQLATLYQWRGTPEGIRLLVEAASKYESLVSVGRNLLLLPDDSQFATGPGNWVLTALNEDIVITAPFVTDDRIEGYGRGVLDVTVDSSFGTGDVLIRCGHGVVVVEGVDKLLTPKFNGVPVDEGFVYGFSVQYKADATGTAMIRWYDKNENFISDDDLLTPSPGDWQELTVQAEAPAGAAYAVPCVLQSSRAAGDGIRLMGAMFYNVGPAGAVTALAPDFYLTLGNEDELLGDGGPVMGDG